MSAASFLHSSFFQAINAGFFMGTAADSDLTTGEVGEALFTWFRSNKSSGITKVVTYRRLQLADFISL